KFCHEKILVAQHVQQGVPANYSLEQVGPLSDRCPHKQAAIAAAFNRELGGVGVTIRDQPLGGAEEVVEDILLIGLHAGAVPLLAELATTAEIGHGKHPTVLCPQHSGGAELRSVTYVETAVRSHQGGIRPVQLETFLVEQEHGYASLVLRLVPDLLQLEILALERNLQACPFRFRT